MARGPLGHAALRYAAAHPERVEGLILFSLPATGSAWPESFVRSLAAERWDLFLQSFTAFDGRPADPEAAVRRMRETVTQDDWACMIRNWIASDVRTLLPGIETPALVLHPRDVIQPLPRESMSLAAGLPNASLVVTDGATQLGDPEQGLLAIDQFVSGLSGGNHAVAPRTPQDVSIEKLSGRELEVLRLIAAGRSNTQIATELTITLNTVQSHVSNILAKTGSTNRTEAAAYAHRQGLA
jgi:DNA-binding CsgD family transcriptional regulator